jgi:hypothetical protein
VNANAYTGVVFWAKRGAGSTEPSELTVSLGMDAVTLSGTGTGTCAGTIGCVRPPGEARSHRRLDRVRAPLGRLHARLGRRRRRARLRMGVNGLDLAFTITLMGTPTAAEVDLDDIRVPQMTFASLFPSILLPLAR